MISQQWKKFGQAPNVWHIIDETEQSRFANKHHQENNCYEICPLTHLIVIWKNKKQNKKQQQQKTKKTPSLSSICHICYPAAIKGWSKTPWCYQTLVGIMESILDIVRSYIKRYWIRYTWHWEWRSIIFQLAKMY